MQIGVCNIGSRLGGSVLPEFWETSTDIEVVDLNLENEDDDEVTLEWENIEKP